MCTRGNINETYFFLTPKDVLLNLIDVPIADHDFCYGGHHQ
jgi:hypothetical protein